jgi:hypothetical protein
MLTCPIGTIYASKENVYLFRENGEPAPIGDGIEAILRAGDMTKAVACFHNNHYKLSFRSTSSMTYNDVELWLDIRKMKALQGKPVWYGIHTGRKIDAILVEYLNADSEIRFAVDWTGKQVYKTDLDGITQDFAVNITSEMESCDFDMRPLNMNRKLLQRFYWNIKTMKSVTLTDVTLADNGNYAETQTLTVAPPANATWAQVNYDATLFLNAWFSMYPFFPQTRMVGRTFRKKLTHSGVENISISGLMLGYKPEQRRI